MPRIPPDRIGLFGRFVPRISLRRCAGRRRADHWPLAGAQRAALLPRFPSLSAAGSRF